MAQPYVFVAYARQDAAVVQQVVTGLERAGVKTWLDVDELRPGQQWDAAIGEALRSAIGILVFVSPASMQSAFVRRELQAAAQGTGFLIIPVILEHTDDLPFVLQTRQWIDLSGGADRAAIDEAVGAIADAVTRTASAPPASRPSLSRLDAEEAASELAEEVRGGKPETAKGVAAPDAVFVVHGTDHTFLDEVTGYLEGHGVKAVVLTRMAGAEQSLFQKFLKWGGAARFAVVLVSADDMGASRVQYEHDGVADKALQFRARQNVILELGFFYGRLGWENVFVLFEAPDRVYPNFESPSDLGGVLFDHVDAAGTWKAMLSGRLLQGGFVLKNNEQDV